MQNAGPPETGSPSLDPHSSMLGRAHTQVHTRAHGFTSWTSLTVPAANHFLSLLNSKPDTPDTARPLTGGLLWLFSITQLSKMFS